MLTIADGESSGVGRELVSGDFPNQNGWLPGMDSNQGSRNGVAEREL